jgi:hypothetical protein
VVVAVDGAFVDIADVASVVDSINGDFADNMDFGKDSPYFHHHHIQVPSFLVDIEDAAVDVVADAAVDVVADAAVAVVGDDVENASVYYQIQRW